MINKIILEDRNMISDALEWMNLEMVSVIVHRGKVYLGYKRNHKTLDFWSSATIVDNSFDEVE